MIDTVFQSLQTRFVQSVATPLHLAGAVVFDNDSKTLPESGLRIRLVVRVSNGRKVSLGSKTARRRRDGLLIAQVFDDMGQGPVNVNRVYELMNTVFSDTSVDGVRCLTTTPTYVGESNGAFQMNATVPFWFDEIF